VQPVQAQSGTLWTQQLDSQVTVTAVSPDGQRVALGTRDNQVRVYDAAGTAIWTFDAANSITGLAWSADGTLLAIASEDRRVYVRAGATGEAHWDFKTSRTVNDVALARDGSLVALTTDDQNIFVLDAAGRLLWNVDRGLGVEAVDIYGTGDDARVVVGSDDGRISIFARAGQELLSIRLDFDVKAVAVARSGGRILAGTSDGSLSLLNGANGAVIWTAAGDSEIVDVAMAADASFMLAASDRGTIYFLDGAGNITQKLQRESPAQSVSVAADGSVLVWGDAAGQGLAGRVEVHLLAFEKELALVVLVNSGQDLDERGLAGAVVAENAGHLTRIDGCAYVLEGDDVAVELRDAPQLEKFAHGCGSLVGRGLLRPIRQKNAGSRLVDDERVIASSLPERAHSC